MSKRINIILPDKTVALLDRLASKGARSRFIDRAVRHYVETQGKASLREHLKAGDRANAERDLAMAAPRTGENLKTNRRRSQGLT
ncbi:MAG: hypothetical protein ACLQVN_02560 [Bryobacteraceae bacterium]